MNIERAMKLIRSAGGRYGLVSGSLALLALGWPSGLDTTQSGAYCAMVLSATELAAISPGAKENSALVRGDGHSECSWTVKGDGEANTLSLMFWEPRAMPEALVPADSPDAFFEIYVKSAEQVRRTKREALPGVGQRSALFRDGKVRELYILTKAGVAHLVTDGLTDAQVKDVARAVAAP